MNGTAETGATRKPRRWDWRALLFELLIVFVGLLAALQVDEYRQHREFRNAIYWARDVRSDWLEWSVRLRDEAEATRRLLKTGLQGAQ